MFLLFSIEIKQKILTEAGNYLLRTDVYYNIITIFRVASNNELSNNILLLDLIKKIKKASPRYHDLVNFDSIERREAVIFYPFIIQYVNAYYNR